MAGASGTAGAAAQLLALSDLRVTEEEGRRRAEAVLEDGSALAAYDRWIRAQGGDPDPGVLPQAPVVVLSDNGIDHLLLMLAAMHVGRAVCSVSSAYCRLTRDYTKIHGILNTLGPGLVYAAAA